MPMKFFDHVRIKADSDILTDAANGKKKHLDIEIIASHAGIANRNIRFYLPSTMKKGVDSFKGDKPLKIFKNHDVSEPYGVIVDAEYVDTIPDNLKDDENVKIMLDESVSVDEQVKAAGNFMASGAPFEDGWKGLGHLKLKARIFDQKTIEQIANKLFDSVSVGFTGKVKCSVCQSDMDTFFGMQIPTCDHELGKFYDENGEEIKVKIDKEDENKDKLRIPCMGVPINQDFKECSLLVFGADPITEISAKDSSIDVPVDVMKGFLEKQSAPSFMWVDADDDSQSADSLKEKDKDTVEDKDLEEKSQKEDEPEKQKEELTDEQFEKIVSDVDWSDSDAIYECMGHLVDKKLSAEERKKLPASAFCGPDRSFPVPDCAHVTAARRLLGRYEGPGDKDKIEACIDRKAKKLGCDKKDKKDKQEKLDLATIFDSLSCYDVISLEDSQLVDLYEMARDELVVREVISEDQFSAVCVSCESKDSEIKNLKEELQDKVTDLDNLVTQFAEYKAEHKVKEQKQDDKNDDNDDSGIANHPTDTVDDPTMTDAHNDSKDKKPENTEKKLSETAKRLIKDAKALYNNKRVSDAYNIYAKLVELNLIDADNEELSFKNLMNK